LLSQRYGGYKGTRIAGFLRRCVVRITTKGRYALRAVLALAQASSEDRPLSIKSLSEQEEISAEFLEQIFFRLRKAGVIRSVRGPGGGFFFSRPLEKITLMEIIDASGEGLGISPCACGKKTPCKRVNDCAAFDIWREMDKQVRSYAEKRTVADMVR
jgi:Rrf2 family transcriptional regulator, iron-sulfur cluster assembly transcription factor